MNAFRFAIELLGKAMILAVHKFWQGAKRFGRETTNEAGRMGVQGAAEVSQALFSQSNAYVPYGRGQNPFRESKEQARQAAAIERQRSRGREM
jgi:hypothetical protein